jgi:DNA-binding protein H-NS
MAIPDLDAMDFEELWRLHEELTKILADKNVAEKLELERRLALLNREPIGREAGVDLDAAKSGTVQKRRYPKVRPKYRNPSALDETWAGRVKRPRWLVKQLAAGHSLEEFILDEEDAKGDRS